MKCPKCQADMPKAGKRRDRLQRYRCSRCSKTFSEQKEQTSLFAQKQAVDDDRALLAIQLLVEGNSLRSVERISGIHRDTVMRLLLKAGERCQALLETKIRNVPVKDVQADEIWTYVRKKESRRVFGDKDFEYIGDAWAFIAIERNSKLSYSPSSSASATRAAQCGSWQNWRRRPVRIRNFNSALTDSRRTTMLWAGTLRSDATTGSS